MSWIDGGQTTTREVDGVTLNIRILTAREMIAFLRKGEAIDATSDDAPGLFEELIKEGLTGWSGDGVPPFGDDALRDLSLPATQRIINTIILANTLTEEQKGNLHAS